jgi:hypothetical protein
MDTNLQAIDPIRQGCGDAEGIPDAGPIVAQSAVLPLLAK